ncbi:hypothetical protein PCE1_002611 [Barthelona sp. PCE]
MSNPIIIAPSILSSDFGHLARDCSFILSEGADWLHVDIMDGHFVPNITIGPPVVKALRKNLPDAFLDCHIMVSKPSQWIEPLAKGGANLICFHVEVEEDIDTVIAQIREYDNIEVGLAIRPSTDPEMILPYIDKIDMVLAMTVEPGFGGQKFNPVGLNAAKLARERRPDIKIQVDGGVSVKTVKECKDAGCNVLVSGSAIFGSEDKRHYMDQLRSL